MKRVIDYLFKYLYNYDKKIVCFFEYSVVQLILKGGIRQNNLINFELEYLKFAFFEYYNLLKTNVFQIKYHIINKFISYINLNKKIGKNQCILVPKLMTTKFWELVGWDIHGRRLLFYR